MSLVQNGAASDNVGVHRQRFFYGHSGLFMSSDKSSAVSKALRFISNMIPICAWIAVAGVAYWGQTEESVDMALRNIITAGSAFLATIITFLWFTFLTKVDIKIRLTVFCVCLTLLVLSPVIFRVQGVSGQLIPVIAFRWSESRDTGLESIEATVDSNTGIDLTTTTIHDFPQFLGPNRNQVVADDRFNFDWGTEKPRLVWKRPIGAGWSAFSAVNGYAVTLEQRGDEEITSCYEISTGEPVWANSIPSRHETVMGGIGPRSTPTIHEGRVYTLGATGVLRCLDGSDGTEIWSQDLFELAGVEEDESAVAWGRSGSPLIVNDKIVVPVGGPKGGDKISLMAFDPLTGAEIWRGGDRQVSYASPSLAMIDGTPQILHVAESSVCGHDPETGEMLWDFSWPGNSSANANTSQAIPISDREIFISKGYGRGAAVFEVTRSEDGWATEEIWSRRNAMKTKFSNVVIHEGFAYGLNDTILECIDVTDGKKQWKARCSYGQVLLVGNTLLVLTEDGELLTVPATPEKHQQLSELQVVDGLTWNNLCLFDKYLLVRNGQEAACYELPTKPIEDRNDDQSS